MNNLRVAINTLSVTPAQEGIRTVLTRLVPALARVGRHHRYRLICSRSNVDLFWEAGDDIERVVLPLRIIDPLHRILHDQITVPFLTHKETDVLFTPSGVGSLLTKIPQVVSVQGGLVIPSLRRQASESRSSVAHHFYDGPVMRLSHRRATAVTTISEYLAGLLIAETGIAADKVKAILNGVDKQNLTPHRPDGTYALVVGTLYPYKNVAAVIEALALARPQLPDGFRLVVVGPDPDGHQTAALTGRASALGVADRVDLLGGVYGGQLEDLYRAATVLVLPSRIEGFGLPVLEAMARGIPVIAANRTALPEVVAGAGVLFDPDNSAELAARIIELTNDPGLRARLISAGRRRADQLSWERAALAYVQVFDWVSRTTTDFAPC